MIAYIGQSAGGKAADQPSSLFDQAVYRHLAEYKDMLARAEGGPNPYTLHQELGRLMTKSATVVRHNADLEAAYAKLCEMEFAGPALHAVGPGELGESERGFHPGVAGHVSAGEDDCQRRFDAGRVPGAHYKPEFAMPDIDATDPAERRRQAEAWCDRFEANNRKWLKTTVAAIGPDGEPRISYEDVDTSIIPPRPRLYGMVGGQAIEEVWKEDTAESWTRE